MKTLSPLNPASWSGKREIVSFKDLKPGKRPKLDDLLSSYFEEEAEDQESSPFNDASAIDLKNKLEKQAEERTWEMYQRLEKENKMSPGLHGRWDYIKQRRDADPNYQISSNSRLMEYFYRWSMAPDPYDALQVNRDEFGECVFPEDREDDCDEGTQILHGLWNGLATDQQYIRLANEVKKQTNLEWSCEGEHIIHATRFAENHGLSLLNSEDIETCVAEVIEQALQMKPLDALRRLGYSLLGKSFENMLTDEYEAIPGKVLGDDYSSVEHREVCRVMFMVSSFVMKGSQEEAKKWIDDYYRTYTRLYRLTSTQCTIPRLEYIELKLRIAKEIKIIKETKEGVFVHVLSSESEEW